MKIKNICVFCGASQGNHPAYAEIASLLGQRIVQQGRRLIYGGGSRGLMGIIANSVLAAGGEVIGIIPQKLVEAETAHQGLSKLEIVADMHTRKARMAELADGFIALPGGIGTLEELFEVYTWGVIGYHQKPVGLLETNNFYQPLYNYLQQVAEEGFIRQEYLTALHITDDPDHLLTQFDQYHHTHSERWVK